MRFFPPPPSLYVSICSISYLLVFIHRMGAAVLSAEIQTDLEATPLSVGLLCSVFFYTYAVMQIPGGILTDRFGPRRVMMTALCLGAFGSALFAAAPNVSWAFAGRFFIGMGMACVLVPSYRLLSEWFSPQEFVGKASVVVSVAGCGGLLAGAPLAMGNAAFGWRVCQSVLSIVALLLAVLMWCHVRDRPHEKNSRGDFFSFSGTMRTLCRVCQNRRIQILSFWFFVNGGICFSFSGLWAGTYFVEVCGWTQEASSFLVSLFGVGIVIGPLLITFVSRIMKGSRILEVSMLLLAVLLGILLLYGDHMAYIVACLWSVSFTAVIAAPFGVVFDIVRDAFDSSAGSLASGLVYTFCMLGAACMQGGIGFQLQKMPEDSLLEQGDFVPVFIGYLVLALIAAVAARFIRR